MVGKKIRLGRILFLGILVLSFGSSLSASAEGGNIGGKPANPDPQKPRTNTIFIKTIDPGKSAKDGVEVINNTEAEKTVQVYAVDSVRSSGGAFACAQAVDSKDDVGSWVKLEQSEVTLQSGQKTVVKFSIEAPGDAEVGEHNGCIVLQEKGDTEFQSGIGLNFRTAIRVAVLIPGDIIKDLKGNGIVVSPKKKTVDVTAKVKSNSNVSLDADINVRLAGILFGKAPEQTNTFPVLSKEDSEWNFEFKRPFWGGFYKAGFTIGYNSDTKVTLGEESSNTNMAKVNGPSKIVFLWPHPLALGLELLILVAVVLIVGFIPKKLLDKKKIKSSWEDYTAKNGDTLEELADQKNVAWKKLAKVNKVKAPYVLVAGSILKVPSEKIKDDTKSDKPDDSKKQEEPTEEAKPEEIEEPEVEVVDPSAPTQEETEALQDTFEENVEGPEVEVQQSSTEPATKPTPPVDKTRSTPPPSLPPQ